MKNIIIAIITLMMLISCGAQTLAPAIILPLYNPSDDFTTEGAYYKDLDGDMDKMVGTWEYTNGSEVFKFTLQKKLADYMVWNDNLSYYHDVLFGEYQYVNSTGEEINNSLDEMDNLYPDISEHLIYGSYIKGIYGVPTCSDCSPDERRVDLLLNDLQRPFLSYNMVMRYVPASSENNNTEQLKVYIYFTQYEFPAEGTPTDHRIPLYQELLFNKVN